MNQADYHDADLLLRLFDLRREAKLRQAREFALHTCKFKDYPDFLRKYGRNHKQNVMIGMVFGYWEMACLLVDRGLLNRDLFDASHFEQVQLWYKFKPVIEGRRKEWNFPDAMKNLERVATSHPAAGFMAQQTSPPKKKAAGAR